MLFYRLCDTELDHRFWDADARKIVRRRNIVFNKQMMYKDEMKKSSMIDLRDLSTTELNDDASTTEERSLRTRRGRESEDEADEDTELDVNERTPMIEQRRSSRVTKLVHKYSSTLNTSS